MYNESSDMEKVTETLEDLMEKLMACSARDKQIREWQKIFKVTISMGKVDEILFNEV